MVARVFLYAVIAATVILAACSGEEKPTATDTTPPAAVSDLRVEATDTTSVTLAWTAPGDDGTEGRAAAYDLRYGTSAGASW